MRVKQTKIIGMKCFTDVSIELSPSITLLVGPNNSGKSTLLQALMTIQAGLPSWSEADIRVGTEEARVSVEVCDERPAREANHNNMYEFFYKGGSRSSAARLNLFPNQRPGHFVVPLLASRVSQSRSAQIREDISRQVTHDMANYVSRIDHACSPGTAAHDRYRRWCEGLLGFPVATAPSREGKQVGYWANDEHHISLESMGTGVAQVAAFFAELSMAKNKLLLIEEPESDLHPQALKAVLEAIAEASTENQIVVSTHSNIVVRRLGAEQHTKIFAVDANVVNGLVESNVEEIGRDPAARRQLLDRLGYEFADTDLWEGWLFLEESSAERINRDFLIPWFASDLDGRLRTYSCQSLSKVADRFDDFNRLYAFINLAPTYKNRAWVYVDAGDDEAEVIERLRSTYVEKHGWNRDRFDQFTQHNFECYYPQRFTDKVKDVLAVEDKTQRWQAKIRLGRDVVAWAKSNESEARSQFAASARDVIEVLESISESLGLPVSKQ